MAQKSPPKRKKRRHSRVNGLNVKGAIDVVQNVVVPVTIGIIGGQVIDKQLTFFNDTMDPEKSNMMRNLIKIGGGVLLASMYPGFIGSLGAGIAVNGAAGIALPFIPAELIDPTVNGVGLIPPGQNYNPALYPGMGPTPGIAPL